MMQGIQEVLAQHTPGYNSETYVAMCLGCDIELPNGAPGEYQNIWTEVYVPHLAAMVENYQATSGAS